ncbi:uncharacterized protein LOC144744058 [Ciona intestinalis]
MYTLNEQQKNDVIKILQEFGNYVTDRLEFYVRPLVGLSVLGNQNPLCTNFCTSYNGDYRVMWRVGNGGPWKGIDGKGDRDELQGALLQGYIVQFTSNTNSATESVFKRAWAYFFS